MNDPTTIGKRPRPRPDKMAAWMRVEAHEHLRRYCAARGLTMIDLVSRWALSLDDGQPKTWGGVWIV
jgi:hypothetical protein